MAKYILRSSKRLDAQEISNLFHDLLKRYNVGDPQWNDDESLKKSGWYYPIRSRKELVLQDLEVIKEKGLALLLTKKQADRLMTRRRLRSFDILANYSVEILDSAPHGTGTGRSP